jgi:hypothetical protein
MNRKELRHLKEQLASLDESSEHCTKTVLAMRVMRKEIKQKILNQPVTDTAEPPLQSVRD